MNKKTTRPKKPTKAEIERTQQLKQEIYGIFQEVSNMHLKNVAGRENSFTNRLNAIENMGMPENPLQEIKTAISQIRYKQHQQQRAIEGLLQFFNTTKQFFEPEPENK